MVIDILIGLTLFVAIIFLWSLNNKINNLRDTRTDFIKMVKFFDEAIVRSEMSVTELKAMGNMTAGDLQQKIEKAKFLSEDLAFMTDRANDLLGKLNNKLEEARMVAYGLNQDEKNVQINTKHPSAISANKTTTKTHSPSVTGKDNDSLAKNLAIESLLARISSFRGPEKVEAKRQEDLRYKSKFFDKV